jgi:dipeptidyl aminopeptidase/acylaminoacyl peptidase
MTCRSCVSGGREVSAEHRRSVERIISSFVPDRLVVPLVRLHAAGGVPKHEAEEFVGGPEIVKELIDRGLAHHAPHSPEAPASLKATPLDVTMMAIVKDLKEQAVRLHERLLEGYENLSEVKSWPRPADGQSRDHLVRVITDPEDVTRQSLTMINGAQHDWMTLETLDSEMPLTEDFVVSAPPMLREGLRVRAIYDQASLDHPMAAANLQRSMAAGEQARVLPVVPTKMQMMDKSAVMLPLNATGRAGAVLLYAEPIVCGLAEYFELMWLRAVPVGSATPPPGCPLTQSEHDVLRLLVQGLTYKAIRHKLDLSESTMTRRMHAIMGELQTGNEFAAGAAAAGLTVTGKAMANYSEFVPRLRLWRSVSVSADGSMVAYVSDASGQFSVWTQATDGVSPARQLTFLDGQAVREVAWAPDASMLAFTADSGGDEEYQVFLVSASGGTPRLVSAGTGQHYLAEKSPFDPSGRYLLYSGNDRETGVPDVIVHDVAAGSYSRFTGAAGGPCFAIAMSPDQQYVLAGAMASNTLCQCCLGDMSEPGTALSAVTAGLPGEYYYPGPWADNGFYVLTTDGDGDRAGLAQFSLADRALTVVDSPAWDVEDVVVPADEQMVVWSVNEDGYSVVHTRGSDGPVAVPAVPDGRVRAMSISADGGVLALVMSTPARAIEVAIVRPGTDEPVRYLTDTRPAALRITDAVLPELVRYPADDGTLIPAFLYRPEGAGPHPVLLSVHGGPEVQARPEYSALHQCLLASGIAVLAPNIRGSSGYGHAWQTRIYRDWGGIDLSDLAAAYAWLSAQPWADESRIAVYGMSYGGFASLSCMTRLPSLWAAGVVVCGMSDLVTLARSMPANWANIVAAMFGDLDDPDVVADLRRRSPLTYAGQISAPLLVVQGANDPRVPRAEADQIVKAARDNGADVRYEVFEDEGHGFTNRENDIKAHSIIVEFLAKYLRG